MIDFFKDNKRIERFSFIDNKVHMKETFNVDNKVCYQVFYDEKGYPYISRNINANNGAVGKTYVLVNKKEFKNNLALCVYYLEKLIKDSKDSIMICDGPGSFPKCLIQIIKMLRNMALFMLIIMKISMIRVHLKK